MTMRSKIFLCTALLAMCALRIHTLFSGDFELFFDEAQYWTWSKNLDWGYFSKPPVIAWLIASTTQICGDSVGCVKLSAPILHLLTAVIVYLSAERLLDQKTAFWSSLLYFTLPGITVGSIFISADAPLLFFWALALYCLIRALETPKLGWWLALGIAGGLGMMSKYTMAVFFVSALLYIAQTPSHRPKLKSLPLWIAALVALVIFLPNILWNMNHGFISLTHTNENVLNSGHFSLHFTDSIAFLGAQFAIFGPVLFAYLLIILIKSSFCGSPKGDSAESTTAMDPVPISEKCHRMTQSMLLYYMTTPLLAIATLIALVSGAQAHWAAPLYISGTILVTQHLLNFKRSWAISTTLLFNLLILIISFNMNKIIDISNDLDKPMERVSMWNNIAKNIKEIHLKYPNAMILSDERKSVASLMYNLRDAQGNPAQIVKWNLDHDFDDYYDMNTNMNNYKNRDFLILTRSDSYDQFSDYFQSSEVVEKYDFGKNHFTVLYMKDFKGY